METDPLKVLFTSGWPWGVVTLGFAVVLGALGGLAQLYVSEQPAPITRADRVKSALIGVVAAPVALWVNPPEPTWHIFELVGFCIAVGFFGKSVLSAVESRVLAMLAEQRARKTEAVAKDAIAVAEGRGPSGSPASGPAGAPSNDLVIAELRGRLAEARGPS